MWRKQDLSLGDIVVVVSAWDAIFSILWMSLISISEQSVKSL